MNLVDLDTLFGITYGVNLDLNKLKKSESGINYVARTQKNNGVTARVELLKSITPNPAGTISVSCGGSVLEAFLQEEPYYSGRDLVYITPLVKMTRQEKLYYCMCIRNNKFRYNFGRQPNKSLGKIKIPSLDDIPEYVNKIEIKDMSYFSKKYNDTMHIELEIDKWKEFCLYGINGIFEEVYLATPYHKNKLKKVEKSSKSIPYITRTGMENGLNCYVEKSEDFVYEKGNALTIGAEGACCFYQANDFICGNKITILRHSKLNKYNGLFISTVINFESKGKYNYGRAYISSRVKNTKIRLPVNKQGEIDFDYMEEYIKTLSFTKEL